MLGEGENNRLQADETIKYGDFLLSIISGEGGSANSESCLAFRQNRQGETWATITFFPTSDSPLPTSDSHFPLDKLENEAPANRSTLYETTSSSPHTHQPA